MVDWKARPQNQRQDWQANFRKKVSAGAADECWLWTGGKNQDGYGRFHLHVDGKRRTKQAHHVAYFLKHGRWPAYVLHACDTPACCNPAHLREGTHQENIDECWNKRRGRRFKNTHLLPEIERRIAGGERNRDICRALGINNDAVSRIRNGHIYGPTSRARAA